MKRLINIANKGNNVPTTTICILKSLFKLLEDDQKIVFRKLLMELTNYQSSISKEEWKLILDDIKKILPLFDIASFKTMIGFVRWIKKI